MGKAKISLMQLEQLVREGNGVCQIAKKMGVTKGSVSKRLKSLRVSISKDVVLRSAPAIVDREISAMDQLKKVNGLINKELDWIEKNIETATGERRRELQEQRLKHVGEIRREVSLLLDIASALYNVDEIKAFQESVLEVIGDVELSVKDRIVKALHERRAIRSTFGFGR